MHEKVILNKLEMTLSDCLDNLDFESLSRHNRSYAGNRSHLAYGESPFQAFVSTEWPYYREVIKWYQNNVAKESKVLDIGTFIPVIPLVLTWLGYKVSTIENLSFYGNALDDIVKLLKAEGVDFINADALTYQFDQKYNCVNLLCVVEHLNGSPKFLLKKIHDVIRDDGYFIFAVPNQARLIRRIGFIFGISIHPPIRDYFDSAYPFTGHNREYTLSEVRYALTDSGFSLDRVKGIKYQSSIMSIRGFFNFLTHLLPKTFHQVFFVVARPV